MTVTIRNGDCREILKTIPDESVHCVVTSPPYWGLRDYGTENQLGLETSLGEHVETMVSVFHEVRRILRGDGTLWLNYGDSYAASPNGRTAAEVKAIGNDDRTFRDKPFSTIGPIVRDSRVGVSGNRGNSGGDISFRVAAQGFLKPKDLCGIPWRVAFALQADGWWLRQDIIWSKPNPMPESVTDRCTKAHEYIFLLSKSARYYYDAEAMAERAAGGRETFSGDQYGSKGLDNFRNDAGSLDKSIATTRNKRSVWEVATAPFSEAHFATFPPALIEPCILAGCPEKCCAKCSAPWVREIETEFVKLADRRPTRKAVQPGADMTDINSHNKMGFNRVTTLGFSASCTCNAGTVPGTCLDPFGGAGTTGLVADRLGRNAILIELNPEYAAMAERRINQDAGMFSSVVTA